MMRGRGKLINSPAAGVLVAASLLAAVMGSAAAQQSRDRIPLQAQRAVVQQYLDALQNVRYGEAFRLLTLSGRAYYRSEQNYAGIYAADNFRITAFSVVSSRAGGSAGRVFFARETARFRDHARDADFTVTATVPVGTVFERGGWRIKDPGHPWRAYAARVSASAAGLRISVKKVSFFARRIELIVSFVNTGSRFVTVLPYGKSVLRDTTGNVYSSIVTRDWSLTDKTLFQGLHLAPGAQYTGLLAFVCGQLDDSARTLQLTIAPLMTDGADAPFAMNIDAIAPAAAGSPAG